MWEIEVGGVKEERKKGFREGGRKQGLWIGLRKRGKGRRR